MKQNLTFLIGMPGAGKTYWGALISSAHGMDFEDMDSRISEKEKRTISEIIDVDGEERFRELERSCLKEIIATNTSATLVACGGGTPCFYDNMQLMKAAGTVVYIAATPEYLAANLAGSSHVRPLLAGPQDQLKRLEDMLTYRVGFYKQAHHILQAKDISLVTFDEILNHV